MYSTTNNNNINLTSLAGTGKHNMQILALDQLAAAKRVCQIHNYYVW